MDVFELDCPQCPQSKTICPQSFWGQIFSMLTMTYERFCDLPPVPPVFYVDTPKKTHSDDRKKITNLIDSDRPA